MQKIKITKDSLILTQQISDMINNQTFHHHFHILFDIANTYPPKYLINYLEIGCYAGGSACLMLQRPNTNVTSIDLGTPISPKIVLKNVDLLNRLGNEYQYIQGNSQDSKIINQISDKQYDIIFIDGNHSYSGVVEDFKNYSKLLKNKGYIIFDDYYDALSSPGVFPAVNDIVKELNDYEIIGTIENTLGARGYPENFKEGNCFVIKKI